MFKHMAENGGGPANPMQMELGKADNGEPYVWFTIGLTKRDEFASRFMAALISNGEVTENKEDLCEVSVAFADALLERLKK